MTAKLETGGKFHRRCVITVSAFEFPCGEGAWGFWSEHDERRGNRGLGARRRIEDPLCMSYTIAWASGSPCHHYHIHYTTLSYASLHDHGHAESWRSHILLSLTGTVVIVVANVDTLNANVQANPARLLAQLLLVVAHLDRHHQLPVVNLHLAAVLVLVLVHHQVPALAITKIRRQNP